jgi:superfamily II DNA/RNA helicase
LHVALGLEPNANEIENEAKEPSPFLVTFEGSARGLHFEAVDIVFVLGRPTSAASYLHLSGRVGRSSASATKDGSIIVNPGTIVSFCTKGASTELEKWTQQIGGTPLEELKLA